MEVVIDLRSRGPGAGTDALDFFYGKEAVGSDAFVGDAELLLAVVENFVAAAEHAADVGADLNVIFAGRLDAQQRVVADHVAHVELGDADPVGDFGDDRIGEVADLVLRVKQHGHESGAPHRVEGDELVKASGERRREEGGLGAHRRLPFPSAVTEAMKSMAAWSRSFIVPLMRIVPSASIVKLPVTGA